MLIDEYAGRNAQKCRSLLIKFQKFPSFPMPQRGPSAPRSKTLLGPLPHFLNQSYANDNGALSMNTYMHLFGDFTADVDHA